ncbi:5043_t:CDS:2 [Acaulospora colombiana]|uniref:5043_t:CDS:1 n=1 Tax=Acaulospora colombiana TaxID=27376 RepID=A0ACA9K651_9GLOM|nr:5043_t:CDS:2 [Acaulospora colombiana]
MKFRTYPNFFTVTYIYRPNPITFAVWILANEDYYGFPQRLSVQLWSNLTSPEWSHTDLIELESNQLIGGGSGEKYRVFEVAISTDHINHGQYEFCFRVKRIMETYEEGWHWINIGENKNGKVHVFDFREKRTKDKVYEIESIFGKNVISENVRYSSHGDVSCWVVNKEAKSNGTCKLDIDRKDILYLIVQQSTGHYVVFIPLTAEDCSSCFRSDEDGNLIYAVDNYSGKDGLARFIVGRGYDPYATSKACIYLAKTVYGRTRESRKSVRKKKDNMQYYEKLGYCTWNAFQENVRQQDVADVLHSLDSSGIHVGYVIMDDGWQQVSHNRQLQSFEVNEKFPDGLKFFIQGVKEKYPYLEHFGVWHTLWGYWNGIDPTSELAEQYHLKQVRGEGRTIHLITPESVTNFYNDFYRFLRSQGVEIVKVDSQASFDLVEFDKVELHQWCKKYQESLCESIERYFDGRVIYSMAHSPSIVQPIILNDGLLSEKITNRPLFRNSDDCHSQHHESLRHIYVNSMNNIWTSLFSIPDWDMFQTNHEYSECHAAARAISGGPIYIADLPHQHDTIILGRCIVKTPAFRIRHAADGKTKVFMQRILRSERSALPSIRDLFEDPTNTDKLLKVGNVNDRMGVLGLWNCRQDEIIDRFDLEDVYGIAANPNDWKANGTRVNGPVHHDLRFLRDDDDTDGTVEDIDYALYFFKNRQVRNIGSMRSKKSMAVMLKPLDFEIVTISPIDVLLVTLPFGDEISVGVACFGLIDKYNGSRAVISAGYISEGWDEGNKYPTDSNNTRDDMGGTRRSGNRRGMVFYETKLIGYGDCGFYLNPGKYRSVRDIKVYLNNVTLSDTFVRYDSEMQFLVVNLRENEELTMEEERGGKRSDYGDEDVLEVILEIKVD